MFVAFCRAERWHVLGAIVAVNWLIYTLAHLVEIGVSLPEQLEFLAGNDFGGAFSWFFITFWLNVLELCLLLVEGSEILLLAENPASSVVVE